MSCSKQSCKWKEKTDSDPYLIHSEQESASTAELAQNFSLQRSD